MIPFGFSIYIYIYIYLVVVEIQYYKEVLATFYIYIKLFFQPFVKISVEIV